MNESDAELMTRCKDGDMTAFDILIYRHKTPLINFIYRFIGDPDSAEDLAQETFIRIYRNIDRYRHDMAGFRTWMYRIASNLCKNELRNRNRRPRILVNNAIGDQDDERSPVENTVDPSPGPDGQVEKKELQDVLTRAISGLPEKLRIALILRDIEGMSYEEISQTIKRPVGTVKSRINRARLMLKDKMAAYVHS
jgi:RNA polymerase sigma-70 factor (ECF subfamily)